MPEILCVDAVGVRVGIDLGGLDEPGADAVRQAWADAVSPAGATPDVVVRPASGPVERVLSSLSQSVTLAAIEAAHGRVWMLHAAGLAGASGDVVVLVGPSGRGKTTASRTLGRTFSYVSDETVAIDESGGVRPYRKPLSVIEDPAKPKRQIAPSSAELVPLPDAPLRVAAIALLDRRPEHVGAPLVEGVELADALAELVGQSSFLSRTESPLRLIAALVAAVGGVRRLVYREAGDLVPVIDQLLAAGAATVVPWEPAPTAAATPATGSSTGPRYRRAPWVDRIDLHDPDRIAVLSADERAVAAALDDLVAAGLLVVEG